MSTSTAEPLLWLEARRSPRPEHNSKLRPPSARNGTVEMLVTGAGEALSVLRPNVYATRCGSSSAAATLLGRTGRHRCDNPAEIGLRSRVAVDGHVLGHIKLQPRDVPE